MQAAPRWRRSTSLSCPSADVEALLHVSPEVKRVVWSKVALFQSFNTFCLPGTILFYSRELLKKAKSSGVKGNEVKMQICSQKVKELEVEFCPKIKLMDRRLRPKPLSSCAHPHRVSQVPELVTQNHNCSELHTKKLLF